MPDILQTIIENKRKEVEVSKQKLPLSKIRKNLKKSDRNFLTALKGKHNIISELKYKSPSIGVIGKKRPIKEIITAYDKYASAISVLTDKKFFGGNLTYINKVKRYTKLPILRKDFTIDEYQIYEARYFGADAVLLIASILSAEEIEQFLKITRKLGMEALVETKTKEEIEKVLTTSAKIIGINNRNLSDFSITLNTTKELKKLIPIDKIIVSESGIYTRNDILTLDTHAVLIGTSLMKAEDISQKLSEIKVTKIKICGITNTKDALESITSGADILGFNFYKKSSRYILPQKAFEIIQQLPNTVQTIGVFVNHTQKEINEISKTSGVDFIQLHGDETEKFCNSLGTNVIKVERVNDKLPKQKELLYARLYDTFSKIEYGGTGKVFEQNILQNTNGKIFVAGGINPENVTNTLRVHPYAIDTCSGVEKAPGIKDAQKVKLLISKVRTSETKQ